MRISDWSSDVCSSDLAMLSNSCVKSEDRLRYSVRYLRGPVAEFLLKRDFDLATWAPKGRPAKIYDAPSNDGLDRLSPETRSAVIFNEVGACVVTATPGETAALFQTERGREAEKAALDRKRVVSGKRVAVRVKTGGR